VSQNSDNEFWAKFFITVLVIAGVYIYFQVKAFAEWLQIDMGSAWNLLGGAAMVVGIFVGSLWLAAPLRKTMPWAIPIFIFSTFSALGDWSGMRQDMFLVADPAWFGLWWGKMIILSASVAVAFGLYKTLNEY